MSLFWRSVWRVRVCVVACPNTMSTGRLCRKCVAVVLWRSFATHLLHGPRHWTFRPLRSQELHSAVGERNRLESDEVALRTCMQHEAARGGVCSRNELSTCHSAMPRALLSSRMTCAWSVVSYQSSMRVSLQYFDSMCVCVCVVGGRFGMVALGIFDRCR